MTEALRMTEAAEQRAMSRIESKGFDPDRRIDARADNGGVAKEFNPDKRIERDVESKNSLDSSQPEDRTEILEATIGDYVKDLKSRSEFADTIPEKLLHADEMKKCEPEETKRKHAEFNGMKDKLIRQWEEANGLKWPTYDHDVTMPVYKDGILVGEVVIRKKGDRYDAHHIKPLSMGGDNVAENITPLSVMEHFDHQGVHRKDGPCDRMAKEVRGRD